MPRALRTRGKPREGVARPHAGATGVGMFRRGDDVITEADFGGKASAGGKQPRIVRDSSGDDMAGGRSTGRAQKRFRGNFGNFGESGETLSRKLSVLKPAAASAHDRLLQKVRRKIDRELRAGEGGMARANALFASSKDDSGAVSVSSSSGAGMSALSAWLHRRRRDERGLNSSGEEEDEKGVSSSDKIVDVGTRDRHSDGNQQLRNDSGDDIDDDSDSDSDSSDVESGRGAADAKRLKRKAAVLSDASDDDCKTSASAHSDDAEDSSDDGPSKVSEGSEGENESDDLEARQAVLPDFADDAENGDDAAGFVDAAILAQFGVESDSSFDEDDDSNVEIGTEAAAQITPLGGAKNLHARVSKDPFSDHFDVVLPTAVADLLLNKDSQGGIVVDCNKPAPVCQWITTNIPHEELGGVSVSSLKSKQVRPAVEAKPTLPLAPRDIRDYSAPMLKQRLINHLASLVPGSDRRTQNKRQQRALARDEVPWATRLTPIQAQLLALLQTQRDISYSGLGLDDAFSASTAARDTGIEPETNVRKVVVLHALNHLLRVRDRVLKTNAKLTACKNTMEKQTFCGDADAEAEARQAQAGFSGKWRGSRVRDSGFTRPRVLVLCPHRHQAYLFVQELLEQFPIGTRKPVIVNKKRFKSLYGPDESDSAAYTDRPADFRQLFAGNSDDCFRMGVSLTNDGLRLFSDFYSSDLIVASPLGLRMVMENMDEDGEATHTGSKDRQFDFLSSIELLVMDQADVFCMQNFDHLRFVMEHMNKLPQRADRTDFSRVRTWNLNNWAKLYRQTVILTRAVASPVADLAWLWRTACTNHSGSFRVRPETLLRTNGGIARVVAQTSQTFRRLPQTMSSSDRDVQQLTSADDVRFEVFTQTVIPELMKLTGGQLGRDNSEAKAQTVLIFIPSYFDFVRVRNWFRKQDLSYVAISEYSSSSDVARGRTRFFHGERQFCLVSERFHFYHRYRLRGASHVVFYAPPAYATTFPEIVNLIGDLPSNDSDERSGTGTSLTLFHPRTDQGLMPGLVGEKRARRLFRPDASDVHMFC